MRHPMCVLALALVSFLLGGAPLPAAGPQGLELDGGLVLLGSTDPQSGPSPIMPALGAVFPLTALGPFTLESSVLLFGTYYQFANGRASPAEPEHREFWTPGVLGDARLRWDWRLSDKFGLGADAGLALLLRLPIPLASEFGQDFGAAFGYMHSSIRFLYPETGIFARFAVFENLDLRVSLRAAWPLYLIWDGEELPFAEGMLVSAVLGFVLKPHTKS